MKKMNLLSAAAVMASAALMMGSIVGCKNGGGDLVSNIAAVGQLGHAMTISDKEISDVGESAALQICGSMHLSEDKALNTYVNKVGLLVAKHCPKQDMYFTFGVLETEDVNAYSTPGGYVFVTRGALRLMDDESELAGVLGHEIGHLVKKHSADAIKRKMQVDAGSKLAQNNLRDNYAQAAAPLVGDVINTVFDQNQEMQADAEGEKYVVAAGYDPKGLLRFLAKMDKVNTQKKLLSSHPRGPERIKALETLANSTTGKPVAERFKANVKK